MFKTRENIHSTHKYSTSVLMIFLIFQILNSHSCVSKNIDYLHRPISTKTHYKRNI